MQHKRPRGRPPAKIKEGMASLWPRELDARTSRFLDAYLLHFNGRRAAVEAGYSKRSAHTSAYEILNRPYIRAHIQLERQRRVEKMTGGLGRDRYLQEVERAAYASMGDFAPMFGEGDMVEKLANLTPDQKAVIGEVTVEEFRDGRSDYRQIRRTKFKLVPKVQSLELLGKANGWIQDKVDHQHLHHHQGLILHALLEDIAASQEGRPIVEVEQPIIESEENAA